MDTVIRTHIKNKKRLQDLEREIISWKEKGLDKLGNLYLLDDGSPMQGDLFSLCVNYPEIEYVRATGTPDTKNGLYHSLKLQTNFPVFCCVDDAVFGKGIVNRLKYLVNNELSKIPDYGLVGTFACYEDNTRNAGKLGGLDLWEIKSEILYALVGHVFSERLSRIIIRDWESVLSGDAPYPGMCDDIWVATLLKKFHIPAYNTMMDYTQHIGINNRTFGESSNSEYYSKMFVGEY